MTSSNIRGQSGTNRKKNKRGQGFESTRKRKEALRLAGFSEEYHKEMEERERKRKESEAKKKKKTQPPKDNKKKQPPKNNKTENKDKVKIPKEGDTTKKTDTTKTDTTKKDPKKDPKTKTTKTDTTKTDTTKKDPKKDPKDTKKKDPKKDNGRLTDNKASDFLDGVKNPVKEKQAKKKPKKRLSAREKMRQKNERRFGKGHVDKLRKKNEDFKKMKRGQMTKEEFIKEHPKSITAQKYYGLRR